MNLYPCFPLLVSDLGEFLCKRPARIVVERLCFVKIGAREAALFLKAQMKLHVRVCNETVWHFKSKKRLFKIFVLRDEVHHLQSYVLSADELCVC